MQTTILGRTGLRISRVGLGCNRIGDQPPQPDSHWHELLHHALDQGVTLFDTAEIYADSDSERLLGEALGSAAEAIFATKVWAQADVPPAQGYQPEYLRAHAEASLRRLQREAIDIYQLHSPDFETLQNSDWQTGLATLRQQGKVRCVGVSTHWADFNSLRWLIASEVVDVLQFPLNLLEPQTTTLLDACEKANIGVLINMPMLRGILTGKFTPGQTVTDDHRARMQGDRLSVQISAAARFRELEAQAGLPLAEIALRYPLSFPAVHSAIPGARTIEQLDANLHAAQGDAIGLSPLLLEEIAHRQAEIAALSFQNN